VRSLLSREEAQAKGLKRFFTGKPCNYGHVDERYTNFDRCIICQRERARHRGRIKRVKRKVRAAYLERKYGISFAGYQRLWRDQHGCCAVCKAPLDPDRMEAHSACLDHDHLTGAVRGLLCSVCNRALGLLQDDPAILHNAICYLEG
jgi:hypothetical protein